jgi:hypothetical protein
MPGYAIAPMLLIASLAWGTQVALPEQPDFSGAWILTSSVGSAGGPESLSIKQTLVQTNVRGEPMKPFFKEITITRRFDGRVASETFQIGVVGGGISSGSPGDVSTYRRVAWEDRALVIETANYTGPARETGKWSERREIWSLDSDGALHVEVTTRSWNTPKNIKARLYRRDAKFVPLEAVMFPSGGIQSTQNLIGVALVGWQWVLLNRVFAGARHSPTQVERV